jgi:hypothetical protein
MNLPDLSRDQHSHIASIAESYLRVAGVPLVAPEAGVAEALWSAPIAIVAHGTEIDPVFFFGNRTALGLFEMTFEDFTRLPSRFSAEPLAREERARLLDRVTRDGWINDYEGVRISATGKRFRITNAAVWNLADSRGNALGQAAAFADWAYV